MNDTAGNDARRLGDLDKLIHEPTRLMIMAFLYVVDSADFVFLQRQTGLTGGNVSSHMARLESAGYVKVEKSFVGKRPQTVFSLTGRGRAAFRDYRETLQEVLLALPE